MVKKRYAGITTEGKILITGLEAKRSDWSMVARRCQKDVLDMVLKNDATEEEVRDYILNLHKILRDLPMTDFLLDKIVDTSREYDMKTNVLKAYETLYGLEQKGGVYKPKSPYSVDCLIGIRWIYSRKGVPIGIPDESSPEDYRKYVDYEWYWDNQVMPPVERLANAIKYNLNTFVQTTLY